MLRPSDLNIQPGILDAQFMRQLIVREVRLAGLRTGLMPRLLHELFDPFDALPLGPGAPNPTPAGRVVTRGTPVALRANTTDATSGVARVDFFVDGILIATDSAGGDGYATTWDTTLASTGLHEVRGRSVDVAGNTADDAKQVVVA